MTHASRLLPEVLRELRRGDPGAALSLLDDAAGPERLAPDPAWHALRGMAMLAGENWENARECLREAVAAGDETPATALNLALACARLDEGAAARESIARLEVQHPTWDEPPFRLAELLRAAGETDAAVAAYERASLLSPSRREPLLRLATLHIGSGAPKRAEDLLLRRCGIDPADWEAWDALGVARRMLGDCASAWPAFERAHALNRQSLPIAIRLADAATALGCAATALARFEAASDADPLNAVLLAARAHVLVGLGRDDDAHELLEAAAAIAPDHAPLAAFGAEMLQRSGSQAALPALRRAVALDPDNRALQCALAATLNRTQRYAEALERLDAMTPAEDERAAHLCSRALSLVYLGRQDEGVAAARAATELAPNQPGAWRMLSNALAYSEGASGAAMRAVLERAAATAFRPSPTGAAPAAPRRSAPGRLRIGLFSGTLKTHPVGWLTLAGFENLDPDHFELHCIGQREGADPMQRRFRAIAAEWHPYVHRAGPDLAAKIRDLRLDLLIELGGYGDRGMLDLCAQRLAPVQIKWVGMQTHSTQMPEMDWFITDRWETPPQLAHLYSERLLLMPDGYVCYSPPVNAPLVAPSPVLARGAPTFGCFNNLAKITPRVIAVWSAILRRAAGSRLVLKTHQLAHRGTADFVRRQFAAHGVGGDQLVLRGASAHRDLLLEYGDVDMVLDPFPYSGGLTTCEALWMGVPVLTCPGETFASRHSASHVSNIGLADWVLPDLDAYADEAVRRAADPAGLAGLRAGLRRRMAESPLCDAPRFGRNLGAALQRAWEETPDRG